jgi:hypothetical protein
MLALSFAAYGFLKKLAGVPAITACSSKPPSCPVSACYILICGNKRSRTPHSRRRLRAHRHASYLRGIRLPPCHCFSSLTPPTPTAVASGLCAVSVPKHHTHTGRDAYREPFNSSHIITLPSSGSRSSFIRFHFLN